MTPAPVVVTNLPGQDLFAKIALGLAVAVSITTLVYLAYQVRLKRLQIGKHLKENGDTSHIKAAA